MALSHSLLLRRARHVNLNRLLHYSVPQKTRRIHSDGPQEPAKKAPQRARKKIRDLPEYFILPDGTRAKPLEDYRFNINVNPTQTKDSCMLPPHVSSMIMT